MKCDDCNSFYIGQKGRWFKKQSEGHISINYILTTKYNYVHHPMDYKQKYNFFWKNLENQCTYAVRVDLWILSKNSKSTDPSKTVQIIERPT